jgi:hypothetical protein
MFGWLKIRTPRERLIRAGIDPDTAWSDDPGLKRWQRSCLRSIGRNASLRKWRESQGHKPESSGMGKGGRQR